MTERRILHAADIHLDSPLQKLDAYEDAPVQQIRDASRRALSNMVDLAIDQEVDLVAIAGDLYDGDWPDQNTGLFFVKQASRLVKAGIRVAVIRGNHDAANRMTSTLPLPKNPDGSEILFDEKKVDCRIFEDIGVAVHGRSYRKRAETDDMVAAYPAPLGGLFNLGLLHTSLSGIEGHEPYAPCTATQLADKDYQYWALGHVHQRGEHQIDGAAPVVFSGNVQGRHIRESGAKGCVIIDIDSRNRCDMSFHTLDVVRWETCHIDASSLESEDELIDQFQAWLFEQLRVVDDRLLVARIRLAGPTRHYANWMRRAAAMESSLRAVAIDHGGGQVWLETLRMKTTPPPRLENVSSTDDVAVADEGAMQSVMAVISELKQNPELREHMEHEFADLLKKLPVELSGKDDLVDFESNDALTELIDEATATLVGRLSGE